MARWVLKPVELVKAAKRLGIREPVSVKPFNSFWAGEYDCEPLHVLWVNRKVNEQYDPNHTIWHELAHALQCERDFDGNGEIYQTVTNVAYAKVYSEDNMPLLKDRTYDEWLEEYYTIPFEREADEIAAMYAERYPLIKIVREP